MKRLAVLLSAGLCALLGCAPEKKGPVEITLQRFSALAMAQYGASTDVAAADGECGIITTLINKIQRRQTPTSTSRSTSSTGPVTTSCRPRSPPATRPIS